MSVVCVFRGHTFVRVPGRNSWHGNIGNDVFRLGAYRCDRCGHEEPRPV